MTPEEQLIAIAEACGHDIGYGEILTIEPDNNGDPVIVDHRPIPDYCNSLDAMAEAEKCLTLSQFNRYLTELTCFMYLGRIATASQRCEAFLRAIGKWKPSTVPKCDSRCDDKDDVLPSKVRVAPSDKSDEERKDL